MPLRFSHESHMMPEFDKPGMICLSDQQQKDSEDKAAVSITEFNSPGPGADNGGEGG